MLKYQKKNSNMLKNSLQGFLSGLDVFGQPPVLRILKKNKFTTSTGFFCSSAITTICVLYLIYQIKQLYDRKSPIVVFSEYQMTDTAPVPLLMNNFTMAISVANLSLNALSTLNTHFTLTVKNCIRLRVIDENTGKTKIQQNCTEYPTEACSDKHFVTNIQKQYFSSINLGYTQCLNYEQWQNTPPILQGQIAGKTYQYITIMIQECRNSTSYNQCAPIESIQKELKTGYYVVHLSDNLVQMKQPGYPFSEYISLQYTTMSIANSKTIIQNLKVTNVITDNGLITDDKTESSSLIQYTNRESQEEYNDQFLILHYITLDQRQAEYSRSYAKIQAILSTIGGLYQVLFLSICFILRPLIQKFMNLQMANKLFRFEDATDCFDDDQNVQENYIVQSPKQQSSQRVLDFDIKKSSFSKSLGKSLKSKNFDKIQDSKTMSQFLKSKKQSLNLTLRDMIVMSFGCKKKEQMQIQYATDKFMSKLDVAYIISKIYEIDKLKLVLLNEDQLQLFNYLPKPVIPSALFGNDAENKVKEIESKKAYQFILQDEKSDFIKLQEAFKSFAKLKKKKELSQIDKNIIEILDEDIIELFYTLNKDQTKLDQIFNQKLSLNLQVSEPDYKRSHSIVDVDCSDDQPNSIPYLRSRS
ncbi:unnamed protein product [Paramecium primaurelia]|uniref:Transmembrane protein n=1 Tax=Paramecium primaurelia TaxID=5886 RepID=A0A8S1JQW7_PARPR|nr:unnamed protein product [Paramecium primaurelia]